MCWRGRPWGEILCHYCGRIAQSVDHIIPKSKGGPKSRWNEVPACLACNGAKADKWPTCECSFCKQARYIYKRMTDADSEEFDINMIRVIEFHPRVSMTAQLHEEIARNAYTPVVE